ncbi:MAG TPA: hypothetical protein VH062_35760 [Polyangiaceae bacterium]|nr:hypothetical protein [Polyangiaceae bacterium]
MVDTKSRRSPTSCASLFLVLLLAGCGAKLGPATPVSTCAGGPPTCDAGLTATCAPFDVYSKVECHYFARDNSRVGLSGGTSTGAPMGAAVLCRWKCVGSEGE